MFWVNFLHIYQPPGQSKKILEKVVNESYRPLFKGLLALPDIKLNLNINGSLTETLKKEGYEDVIESIRSLAETERLEFTETAKYHPLLPFLDKEEFERQVRENHETNSRIFGENFRPVCFFPPEMAYSPEAAERVNDLGYQMIILDEISFDGGKNEPPRSKLFKIKGTDIKIAFREKRISNAIMSAVVRSPREFESILEEDINKQIYLCTAMDGETFGHHRPGLEDTFFKVLSSPRPEQIFFSELTNYFEVEKEIEPVKSSWASSREDIERGVQFYSWRDPDNKIHSLQWEFVDFLRKTAGKKDLPREVREKISRAYASDQFFWASGEPWWSIEMIEKGAWLVLDALKSIPGAGRKDVEKGKELYKEILYTAFSYQRSGKIEQKAKKYKEEVKIPFKERTAGEGKPEVYYAFIEKMKEKMWEAAEEKNFERAILWRDAIWKLETKNDIYDAVHAVDLLRMEVPDKELTDLMDKYKKDYKRIKPGQPERRGI